MLHPLQHKIISAVIQISNASVKFVSKPVLFIMHKESASWPGQEKADNILFLWGMKKQVESFLHKCDGHVYAPSAETVFQSVKHATLSAMSLKSTATLHMTLWQVAVYAQQSWHDDCSGSNIIQGP